MQILWKTIIYSLRIRRVEYRVAEVPILMIPILLTVRDVGELTSLTFWEGVLVFFFLFAFGDLVNCLADRDLDARYKPHLTEAVYGLGTANVKLQAAASALAALVLTIHIAWQLERWLLLPALVTGLIVAWGYSVPPLCLKKRGLWQLLFYWLGLFVGPMIFAAWIVHSSPAADVYLVAFTYGLLQTGVILVNTAEDYPEDREAGMRTAIVALGLRRGITVALALSMFGAATLLASLIWISWHRSLQGWGVFSVLVVAASCLFAIQGIWRLRRGLLRAGSTEHAAIVKTRGKLVPLWITGNAVSTLLFAVAVLLS